MPFKVRQDTGSPKVAITHPTALKFEATREPDCALEFDLEIPCMPFTVKQKEGKSPRLDATVEAFVFSVTQTPDCELEFDLEIPCMPFEISPKVGIAQSDVSSFTATKLPGTCTYELDLRLGKSVKKILLTVLPNSGNGVRYVEDCGLQFPAPHIKLCTNSGILGEVPMIGGGTIADIQMWLEVDIPIPVLAWLAP